VDRRLRDTHCQHYNDAELQSTSLANRTNPFFSDVEADPGPGFRHFVVAGQNGARELPIRSVATSVSTVL
jgi:hypothetical protein